MAKLFHPYSRGIVGVPTVLLVLSWLGLWMLWPLMGRHSAERERASAKLYHSPVGGTFVRPWVPSISEKYLDESTESPLARFRERRVEPKYLAQSSTGLLATEGPQTAVRARARRSLRTFSPYWENTAVFEAQKSSMSKLSTRLSGGLEEIHLMLPGISIPEMTSLKRPWRAVVRVETGKNGRVAHVFMKESSGNKTIDKAVVREMHKGVIPELGVVRSGSIVVNYGAE